MKRIIIINGPNLNLLGERDPELYGRMTLEEINQACKKRAEENQFQCDFYQFNSEVEIINTIQANGKCDGIVINPAAFTHTSVAIRDAIDAIEAPVIEVHLSNIYQRGEFRHVSYTAAVCVGQISGLGWQGYLLAIDYLTRLS